MHDRPSQRIYQFELFVLALFFLPTIAFSLLRGSVPHLPFHSVALSSIFQNSAYAALILYFVWRNREQMQDIGLSTRQWHRELLVGILLFLPFSIAVGLIERMFRLAGLSAPTELPSFLLLTETTDYLLAPLFLVVVAFAEELIFRGYLIHRLKQLTGNIKAAVLISSLIFSLGHGYQGSLGVATVGAMGVLFGVVYLWRESLIAPMTMHLIQNFIGLVVAPYFGNSS
jgi:uncharacterized protein